MRALPDPVKQMLEAIPVIGAPDGRAADRLLDVGNLRAGARRALGRSQLAILLIG